MEESNFAKKKEDLQTQTQTPEQEEEKMAAIAPKQNQEMTKEHKGSETPKKWEPKKEIDKTESKSSKLKDNEVIKESDKSDEEKETKIEESKPSKQEESSEINKEPESPKEKKIGEKITKKEGENLKQVEQEKNTKDDPDPKKDEQEENKKEIKDEPENSAEDEKKIQEAKPSKDEDEKELESPKEEKEAEPIKEEQPEEPEQPKEEEKKEDPKPSKKELRKAAKEAEKRERIEKARAKRAQEEASKHGEITDDDVPQRTVDKGWALAQAVDDKKEVRVIDDSKADSSSEHTGKSKKSSWFNFSLIKREPSRFKPTINPEQPSGSPQSVDTAIKVRKAKQRYKQEMAHLRQSYEYRLGLVRQLKHELKSNFKSDQQQLHSNYQLQLHDKEIRSSAEHSSESDSGRKPEVQDNKDDKAST